MSYTSANVHYWSTVIDALSCVYNYMGAVSDDDEWDIRYEQFREAVKEANSAYNDCDASEGVPFGMDDDDARDRLFSLMVMSPRYLDICYKKALTNYSIDAAAIPLRSL